MSVHDTKIERVYTLPHLLNCMIVSGIISAIITSVIWYILFNRCLIVVNPVN